MVLSKACEANGLVTATLSGVVTSSDQADLVSFVRAAVARDGASRVLVLLDRYAGWHYDPGFAPKSLWLEEDEGVQKIAFVGDPAWKLAVLTVVAQPLRQVPIDYFVTEAAARRWLERADAPAGPAST